jgi:phosphoserine aminotransferase
LDDIGGLNAMNTLNQRKAALLYEALDQSDGFYLGRAARTDRSVMNAVFNLKTPELEQRFLSASRDAGFSGLSGHRAIGGIRASMYNGLELQAVEKLVEFMSTFQKNESSL